MSMMFWELLEERALEGWHCQRYQKLLGFSPFLTEGLSVY